VFSPLLGRYITAGEIACYLSHAAAISRFVESRADYACIFEDDVQLSPDIVEVICALQQKMGRGIVKLEGIRRYDIDLRWTVESLANWSVLFRFKPTTGAGAYFLTRSAAVAFQKRLFPIKEPFDSWLRAYWRHQIPVYELFPFVASQVAKFDSSILDRDRQPKGRVAKTYRPWMGAVKFWLKTVRVLQRIVFFVKWQSLVVQR
jgi:glycosyl transferase family 25